MLKPPTSPGATSRTSRPANDTPDCLPRNDQDVQPHLSGQGQTRNHTTLTPALPSPLTAFDRPEAACDTGIGCPSVLGGVCLVTHTLPDRRSPPTRDTPRHKNTISMSVPVRISAATAMTRRYHSTLAAAGYPTHSSLTSW